jgi:hypothetical protein
MITRILPMTFGDIAAVIKPIPNVALTTEVQISAVGMHKGQLSYTVAVRDDEGKIVDNVGPYPAHAFRFLSHCGIKEGSQLVDWLVKQEGK